MPRDESGLMAAVDRATPARLARFVAYVDPGQPAWRGHPSMWSASELRCAAFVAASGFWARRANARYWRAYRTRHAPASLLAAAE